MTNSESPRHRRERWNVRECWAASSIITSSQKQSIGLDFLGIASHKFIVASDEFSPIKGDRTVSLRRRVVAAGQLTNRFELEALEPRVLLSGNALLVSAISDQAPAHRPTEVVHCHPVPGGQTPQDSLRYHAANAPEDMFAGLAREPLHSQTMDSAAAPATHSSDPNQGNSAQDSVAAVHAKAAAKTDVVSTLSFARISTARPAANSTRISGSANTMTQQLTASLTAANGPPASAVLSPLANNPGVASTASVSSGSKSGILPKPLDNSGTVDLLASIIGDLATFGSSGNTTPSPINLGNATLAGVLSAQGVQLTFASLTISSGTVTSGTVTITATSATFNLGGAVTSTIGAITGRYDVLSKTFSLTLNSVSLAFSSFVNVSASSASLTYSSASNTTVTLSDNTTKQVSLLEVGADNVTIFAGVNGPGSNSGAVGAQATGAEFGLALFEPTLATDTSVYFGLEASAASLSGVGLPAGVTLSAGKLNAQINGGSGSAVVNFNTSFASGTGLTIQTGGAPVSLDYTAPLTQVTGNLALAFTSYLSISGGFAFSQSGSTVNINIGTSAFTGATALSFALGSGGSTFFSATGGLAMSFDADSISITTGTLTVNNGFNIPNIMAVTSPTVTLSNITVNKATGLVSGAVVNGNLKDPDLTITAGSATVLPGNATVTASVSPTSPGGNGVQGVFNVQSGEFTITLQQFALTVGSVFSASATDVVFSYNPTSTGPAPAIGTNRRGHVGF